jgi:6-phosphogluconolactonase (cycloisomerase 2 family)
MKKIFSIFCLFLMISAFSIAEGKYVVVTAANAPNVNELLVYDGNGKFLQGIPTNGQGGVPPNKVGGGIANKNNLVAVINHGSQNVSIFKKDGNSFKLAQIIPSKSNPVSVAFGPDHLYILGTTTIESHAMSGDAVTNAADGSSNLLKADGSAAQVGVLSKQLIISEKSNTIELVDLKNGVVTTTIKTVQLPPPPKNDTPVGLATNGDVAYVTIAHSNEVGLVKDGKLKKVVSSEDQNAPCWLALMGTSLFCSNTPSKTISIYKVSDNDITLDKKIAATIQTGGLPSDLDAKNGILVVLDTGNGSGHISQYRVGNDGNLQLLNTANTTGTANGIAIIEM